MNEEYRVLKQTKQNSEAKQKLSKIIEKLVCF